MVSVSWDGRLYDCDFDQMLEIAVGAEQARGSQTIWEIDTLEALVGQPVATGSHCFGCTAGSGSSCSSALC